MTPIRTLAKIVTCVGCIVGSSAAFAISFKVTDLGTLGGTISYATAINNNGQVVGWSNLPNDRQQHATLWNGALAIDLGTLGGENSYAAAISNTGNVVGVSSMNDGIYGHATLWTNNGLTDLGRLGGVDTSALGINDAGDVVGTSYSLDDNTMHAVLWRSGVMSDLGSLGGPSNYAYGINNQGQVIGYSQTAKYSLYPVIWAGGTVSVLGGASSESAAYAINDLGQAVGVSYANNYTERHATLWNNGLEEDLEILGSRMSFANDINNSGQIVGITYQNDGGAEYATLWSGGDQINLNSVLVGDDHGFANLERANGINDFGQIVGYGRTISGEGHAFLLTPIPEPETYSLVLLGVALVGLMHQRSHCRLSRCVS